MVISLTAGCDKPEIKGCERALISSLVAPSTYKRIEATSTRQNQNPPTFVEVNITYDAKNPMGVPIRGHERCLYPLKNGKIQSE